MVIKALSLMINRQNKSYDECIVYEMELVTSDKNGVI